MRDPAPTPTNDPVVNRDGVCMQQHEPGRLCVLPKGHAPTPTNEQQDARETYVDVSFAVTGGRLTDDEQTALADAFETWCTAVGREPVTMSSHPAAAPHERATAYVVTAWQHTYWHEPHPAVPTDVFVRPLDGTGAHPLMATCATCGEVLLPAVLAAVSAATPDERAADPAWLIRTVDASRAYLDNLPASTRPAWYRARVNGDDAWWESLVQAECDAGHVIFVDDGDGTVYACPACALGEARAALAARPAPVVSREAVEPTFTERQAAAWPEAVARINRHGIYMSEDPTNYNWTLHWADEVRPGRGHYLDAHFNDGEHFAQITMDVYGSPMVSVASLNWIHSDGAEECDCEHCQADRDSDAEADAALTVADAPAADDECCGWCGTKPTHAPEDCPRARDYQSQQIADAQTAADDEGARA